MISLRIRLQLLTATLITVAFGTSGAAPVLPGLHNKHPLNEGQIGTLLIQELRCASCHYWLDGTGMKEAPILSNAGSRLTPEYLRRFIANPSAAHSGTTTPDVMGERSPEERKKIVNRSATTCSP